MPIPDDVDPDHIISRLAGPLEPAARVAFRRAAEAALAALPCAGEGIVYRTLAPLQRAYFDPPDDRRAGWHVEQDHRASKLKQASPIEYAGDLRHVRYRKPVG